MKNTLTLAELATRRDLKELELNLTIKIGVLIVAALGFLTALQKLV